MTVLGNDKTAEAEYQTSILVEFTPEVTITIPGTDAGGDGVNDFTGTDITVTFAHVGSTPVGCTATASETWQIDNTGTATRQGVAAFVLVGRPAGQADSCSYTVTFPSSVSANAAGVSDLTLSTASVVTVSNSDKTAEAEYQTSILVEFTPEVTITIPGTDAGGDGVNDFTGTDITVMFAPVGSTPLGCTATASETWQIDNTGTATRQGVAAFVLVGRPAGQEDSCSYTVTFPGSVSANAAGVSDLTLSTASVVMVSNSDKTAEAEYQTSILVEFTPELSFTIPGTDAGGDGVNDFTGTQITVMFAPVGSTPVGCTATASEVWQIDNTGAAARPGAAFVLVGRPAGQEDSCSYTVTFPGSVSANAAGVSDLTLSTASEVTVSNSDKAAEAEYQTSILVEFTPEVTITIPGTDAGGDGVNDFTGTQITVTFAPVGSLVGCTATASETWQIDNNGDTTRQSNEGAAAVLVGRPAGQEDSCSYSVTSDLSVSNPALRPLNPVPGTISATARAVEVQYTTATVFTPELSFTIPGTDAGGDGVNDFTGTDITVTFAPVGSTPVGCTATASETWQIDNTGAAARQGVAAVLVDVPAGQENSCSYTATFPGSVSANAAGVSDLTLSTASEVTVSNSDKTATAEYQTSILVEFTPEVTITIPGTDAGGDGVNDFTGTDITVMFAPVGSTPVGCTATASEVWQIDAAGTATRQSNEGAAFVLVGRPAGQENSCSYTVTFPGSVSANTAGVSDLTLSTASEVTVSNSDKTATAEYQTSILVEFTPEVTITIPGTDAGGDGVNDFTGTDITVTFAPVGSLVGCTATASEVWQIDAAGAATRQGVAAFVLVGRPAGQEDSCSYSVTFPGSVSANTAGVSDLTLSTASEVTVSNSDKTAEAEYQTSILVEFTPEVTITIPGTDAGGDGVNDFTGTDITVMFAPVGSTPVGCTATALETWQIDAAGAAARQGVAAFVLVGRPAGQEDSCSYTVTFPGSVSANAAGVSDLTLSTASEVTVSNSDKTATAEYQTSILVEFTPEVTITIPGTDAGGDGVNDFTGTDIIVTFAPVGSTPVGCTATASEVWQIDNTGAAARQGVVAVLVDVPAGQEDSCSYTATFPGSVSANAAGVSDLTLSTASVVTVSSSDKAAAAEYQTSILVEFTPEVTITIPGTDAGGDGVNDFTGTQITVTFTPVGSTPVGCTATASEVWQIDNTGTATRQGVSAVLVGRPAGQETSCSYSVTSDLSVSNPALRPLNPVPGTISATARAVEVQYTTATVFSPELSFTIPGTDADGDGVNDFTGTDITVTFAPVGSLVGCTATASEVWQIDNSGAAARQGVAAVLVDVPAGQENSCSYTATFPGSVSANAAGVSDLTLSTAGEVTVSNSDKTAAAEYQTSILVEFTPELSFTIPGTDAGGDGVNDFTGTQITVMFAPVGSTPVGCTATASETWQIDNTGAAARQGVAAVLVDVPAGQENSCSYTATFPGSVSANAAGVSDLTLSTASEVTVSGNDKTAAAEYQTSILVEFTPEVTITIPGTDAGGDGVNDFTGTDITVTFTPVGSLVGCTATASEVWQIDNTGTATRQGVAAFVLVGRPAGQEDSCSYTVTFPGSVSANAAGVSDLTLSTASEVTVSNSDKTAEAEYQTSILVEFTPEVTITIPGTDAGGDGVNDFTGTDIAVMFAPVGSTPVGCTATASEVWQIDNTGAAARQGVAAFVLVGRPAGQEDSCSYTVTFPGSVSANAAGVSDLTLSTASEVTVSGSDKTAAAEYQTSILVEFTPEVTITIPGTDAGGDGVNDFTGTDITVTFAPVGSLVGCTATASETWQIDNTGAAARQGVSAVLVDVPAGQEDSCSYTATFPGSVSANAAGVSDLTLSTASVVTVSGSDKTAAAEYQTSILVEFTPEVTITIPGTDAGGDGVNDFTGTQITVTFTPVGSTPVGCTATASEVWQIDAAGTATRQSNEGTAVVLVGRPAGQETSCSYSVTSDLSVSNPALRPLNPVPGTISATARAVEVEYTTATVFSPELSFTIPGTDAGGDGVNDFTGTDITVMFASVGSTPVGCTATASEVWQIDNTGAAARQGVAAVLVDVPAGQENSCSYTVTFPGSVSANAAGVSDLTLSTAGVVTVSGSDKTATAEYQTSILVEFTPEVTITIPGTDAGGDGVNDFTGTQITVTFAPVGSLVGCTAAASEVWQIDNTGAAARQGVSAVLVDVPAGQENSCSYTVTFPGSVSANAAGVSDLTLSTASEVTVSGSDKTAEAEYQTSILTEFTPEVTITIPGTDAGGDGVNDFTGTQITVTFAPVGSLVGCTAAASEVWQIDVAGTAARQGVAAVLVDVPAGQENSCSYTVTFPGSVSANAAGVSDLTLSTASEVTVSGSDKTAEAEYQTSILTEFTPEVTITIPGTDAGGDGVNDFTGTDITVMFASVGSTPVGCTATASETWQIDNSGAAARQGVSAVLVDVPAGQEDSCSYTVTFPGSVSANAAGVSDLTLSTAGVVTVSGSDKTATAEYQTSILVEFTPEVTITIPGTDASGDGVNDFTGTAITVTFAPVGSLVGCTATASEVWQIDAAGTATRQSNEGAAVVLVGRPAGQETSCSYSVTSDLSVSNPALRPLNPVPGTISATARAVKVEYTTATVFSPELSFTIPGTDAGGDGVNDFTGTAIIVMFAPVGSLVGCTATASEVWQIDNTGAAARQGVSAVLVDVPAGQENSCSYTVTFPGFVSANADGVSDLTLSTASVVTVSSSDKTAAAEYQTSILTEFTPEVTITIPGTDAGGDGVNDFTGTQITVTFTPVGSTPVGCTATASEIWQIDNTGTATRQSNEGAAAVLVGRPAGQENSCSYSVTSDLSVSNPALRPLNPVPGTISATARAVKVQYTTATANTFQPAVTISVPDFRDTAGGNIYAGADIGVRFSPVDGSDARCVAAGETWRVGTDGTVERRGVAARLVDLPEGQTTGCSYDVNFEESVSTSVENLLLNSTVPSVINAGATSVTAVYVNAQSTFSPALDITVPAIDELAGQTIMVMITPTSSSHAGCSATASEVWEIAAGGSVMRQSNGGVAAVLVDRPQAVMARCEYEVEFPTSAASGNLMLSTSPEVTANAGAGTVAAVYENIESRFMPDVDIVVPDMDDLAGITITIDFNPVPGSDAGCLTEVEQVWEIGVGGAITPQVSGVMLVDRPEGIVRRCVYNLEVPPIVMVPGGLLLLESGGSATVSALAATAEIEYMSSLDTVFLPEVTISVLGNDNDGDDSNDFIGTAIEITFTPVTDSEAGCSETVRKLWRVTSDGTAAPQGSAAVLVDVPAGLETNCQYNVELPATVDTAAGLLVLVSTGTITISEQTPSVAASYTVFIAAPPPPPDHTDLHHPHRPHRPHPDLKPKKPPNLKMRGLNGCRWKSQLTSLPKPAESSPLGKPLKC